MIMSMLSVMSVIHSMDQLRSSAPPMLSSVAVGKEVNLVSRFREAIKDVLPADEYFQSDRYLLRFLRAKDLNLKKAEEMFRKSISWRKKNGMDQIRGQPPPADMMKRFYFETSGEDKEGCPILTVPFGEWDIRTFLEKGPKERELFDQHSATMWEKAELAVENARLINDKPPCNSWVIVADVSGFSYWTLTSRQSLEAILKIVSIYEDNYPDGMKIVYIINAPYIFSFLLSILKPVVRAGTFQKMTSFDTNKEVWTKAVLKTINADQLSPRYGGTKMY